jgi:hypothetical protein
VLLGACTCSLAAPQHPRIFITAPDIPRLRAMAADSRRNARHAGRWEKLGTAATAPQGAARAVILLSAEGLESSDRVWFDDASFVEVPD